MLTHEEMMQFHQKGRVTREGVILGKIPFVIRTFSVGDNLAFAESLKEIKPTDSEDFISNFVAQKTLHRCLVSFNNKVVTEEEINSFLPVKCNLIMAEWRKLTQDLEEYLKGFSEKGLDPEEVEQFILEDEIVRGETLHGPEGAPPIRFEYKVLNISDHTDVHAGMRELFSENTPKIYFEAELQRVYAARVIRHINGMEVDTDSILDYSAEFIAFVLNRAVELERQMIKILSSPSEVGEVIKKS